MTINQSWSLEEWDKDEGWGKLGSTPLCSYPRWALCKGLVVQGHTTLPLITQRRGFSAENPCLLLAFPVLALGDLRTKLCLGMGRGISH